MNDINVAAGVMLQTLHRRGRQPWAADAIVDPRLLGHHGAGRSTKPGLELAVDAMEELIALDGVSVLAAAKCVACNMRNFWEDWQRDWIGTRGDRQLLNAATLEEQLRRKYYHRRRPAKI